MTSYADIDDIKAELGISGYEQDAYLERQVRTLTATIERETGRTFGPQTSVIERVSTPWGQRRLIVRQSTPITSITSITIDGATIDSSKYEIEDPRLGFIRCKDGFWESTGWGYDDTINYYEYDTEILYEITYDGGDPEVPADIESAVIDATKAAFNAKGSAGVASVKVGDASTSFATYKDTGGVHPAIHNIISAYKRVEVL